MILTITGTVSFTTNTSPQSETWGIDYGGYFGPVGGALYGLPFSVIWTGTDCNCHGQYETFNPVIDTVLTINDISYDFGAGLGYYNSFTTLLQQNADEGHQFISMNLPINLGSFSIGGWPTDGVPNTQAFLTIPVPLGGGGVLGLVLLVVLAARWVLK